MNESTVLEIFKRFHQENPHPTTELKFKTSFELLIAVILSAQATDVSVNKVTPTLFAVANTPQKILDLGLTELKQHIKTIGLYNTKAHNIIKACHILIEQYQGRVPKTREALEALPGVGRKTANVILNTAFGEPTIAVDTHIFRVAQRIGFTKAKTPLGIEKDLLNQIPEKYLKDAHHWLVLHGRYVCVARKPKCPECLIRDLCEYPHKTTK